MTQVARCTTLEKRLNRQTLEARTRKVRYVAAWEHSMRAERRAIINISQTMLGRFISVERYLPQKFLQVF